MSKVSESVARQNASLDRIDTAVAGITSDITALNDLIAQLQATQGEITPEDQSLLDQIEARGSAAADKLAALDNENPKPTEPPATA